MAAAQAAAADEPQRRPIERPGEFGLLGLRFQRLRQLVRSVRERLELLPSHAHRHEPPPFVAEAKDDPAGGAVAADGEDTGDVEEELVRPQSGPGFLRRILMGGTSIRLPRRADTIACSRALGPSSSSTSLTVVSVSVTGLAGGWRSRLGA